VFGSLLHGFHHPQFSDLDFIVYGRTTLEKLLETLHEQYNSEHSLFTNEFKTAEAVKGKLWRFRNFSAEEFVWHQKRKLIYALFEDGKSGRVIKTEFEPVKDWKEIVNEYDSAARISQKGWVRLVARIVDDSDAPFIPSVYGIEPVHVLEGITEAEEAVRIVSFMEEFRMQASKDEKVYVEGNLEEVKSSKGSFYQIALTYCPRYYEQALKVMP
jgi:predicted nucleotidyltransferase